MKKKIFIDTDIILDVVLKREPFFYNSQKILALVEKNFFSGFTSSLIIANCFYIIGNNRDNKTALKTISKLRAILNVLPFTDKEIGESLNSEFKDFEDGIQYFIALNNNIDILITRNISDYKGSDVNALSPKDFLNLERIKRVIES